MKKSCKNCNKYGFRAVFYLLIIILFISAVVIDVLKGWVDGLIMGILLINFMENTAEYGNCWEAKK